MPVFEVQASHSKRRHEHPGRASGVLARIGSVLGLSSTAPFSLLKLHPDIPLSHRPEELPRGRDVSAPACAPAGTRHEHEWQEWS